ncbi:transposable element Tcb2 transposase [Trichonephila clavipes]|uniref:Transposable element Tcb2 transposase n=1 Tax=Trichonephila clavipes TaxID=2585209 RepID=A0A8X6SYU2_TRICX|nr:transposable element Tcb2 transposase [Trichonephila clavipes]
MNGGRVLFTDESRFSLSSDSHRILIWRERGSRNHPSNIIERDRYGGHGVLVWGGIMLGSRTDLHIFDAVSVNGTRYFNEILLPYVRLFRGAMGLQFLFIDDNAPCHRTVAAEQLLESRRLAARTLPPVTIRELRLALQDEWAAMPQQLIDTLILSMGRRCETCLAVREIIFPTKDQMFLAGHPSQGCFGLQSHCAPCYFFNQAFFIPLISLLLNEASGDKPPSPLPNSSSTRHPLTWMRDDIIGPKGCSLSIATRGEFQARTSLADPTVAIGCIYPELPERKNVCGEFGIITEKHIVACVTEDASMMVKFGKIMSCEYHLCYAHAIHLAVCDVLYNKQIDFVENTVEVEDKSHEEEDNDESEELVEDLDKALDLELESGVGTDALFHVTYAEKNSITNINETIKRLEM